MQTPLIQEKILQKLVQIFEAIPFNRMLGLRLDSVDQMPIKMSFEMKEDLIGNFLHGILHGGVISSVLDMAGGVAAMITSVLKHADKDLAELHPILGKSSTVSLQVNYLRPGKGSRFVATASVLHSGNKICFTRMELHNEEGALIASGEATYLVG